MSDTFSQPIVKYGYEQNYRFKPTDDEWGDTAGRVVDALLKPDEDHPRYAQLRRRAYDAIYNRRFLPGGRVIANAGTSYDKATMINCYVSGPRKDEHDIDSIDSIYREIERCAKILASEGGYGFNADWMRPRGAVIRGSGARTPGAVEMLNLWDQTSHTLTKGPEMENDRDDAKEKIRKGAMMVTMSLWHPDVREFITAKQEAGRLSKFNMSVLVSDKFMEAVEGGDDWYFVYPDYEKAESRYEAEWDGNIRKWSEKGLPMKTYDSIPARDLWNEIMESTYERNEPGVLFVDTINDRNPLYYEEHIKATNACSEWPMPPGGTCNLTNLVLPRYVGEEGDIDYEQMSKDIHMAVRLGDNVNDVAYVPFERQQKELQQKRRIGLGHMGFGSMCAMRGIRYGSERSVEFARSLQRFITNTAYQASAKLAYEKEPFPLYDEEKHAQGDMHQRLNNDTRLMIEKYGLRNSHLLSIQPTGNTSILAGSVSGGLEPIFSAEYTRTVEWPMLPDEIDKATRDRFMREARQKHYAEKEGSSPGSPVAGSYVEADEAKSIVSDVVSDALAGHNDKYQTEDGYVQWAKVKRVIHAKIDEAAST